MRVDTVVFDRPEVTVCVRACVRACVECDTYVDLSWGCTVTVRSPFVSGSFSNALIRPELEISTTNASTTASVMSDDSIIIPIFQEVLPETVLTIFTDVSVIKPDGSFNPLFNACLY